MVTRYELEKEMPKMREKYHKMERKEKGAFLDSMERVTGMRVKSKVDVTQGASVKS